MKGNKRTWYIIAGIGLVLLIAVFWNATPKYNWEERFQKDKAPYDTDLLQQLLEDNRSVEILQDSLRFVLPELTESAACYFFVGDELLLDSLDSQHLIQFIEQGNTAFISSKSFPFSLIQHLLPSACLEDDWTSTIPFYETTVKLYLEETELPGLPMTYFVDGEKHRYFWRYFDAGFFCEDAYFPYIRLGSINETHSNFIAMPVGAGMLYLHSTPLVFSNYHLRTRPAFNYTAAALNYLPQPAAIYWDRYNQLSEIMARSRQNRESAGSSLYFSDQGPLKYLLSQPALAWAWYIGLGMALLFLVFRARRRQRIIPVPKPNPNTSLEFVKSIGRLYFMQKSHRKLALQQHKHFFTFIRERYQLSTREVDEAFTQRLIQKSDLEEALVRKLLGFFRNIENSEFLSENALIDLHQLQEKFYQNCK